MASRGSAIPQAPRSDMAEKPSGQATVRGTSNDHTAPAGSAYRSKSLPQDCPADCHLADEVSHRATIPPGRSCCDCVSPLAARDAERA